MATGKLSEPELNLVIFLYIYIKISEIFLYKIDFGRRPKKIFLHIYIKISKIFIYIYVKIFRAEGAKFFLGPFW